MDKMILRFILIFSLPKRYFLKISWYLVSHSWKTGIILCFFYMKKIFWHEYFKTKLQAQFWGFIVNTSRLYSISVNGNYVLSSLGEMISRFNKTIEDHCHWLQIVMLIWHEIVKFSQNCQGCRLVKYVKMARIVCQENFGFEMVKNC
jgi:hypothetical protein